MTYKDVIEGLLAIARELGAGYAEARDVTEVSQMPDLTYPLFYVSAQRIDKNLDILQTELRFVYGEPLNDDRSNYLDVQSRGIEFISKVINTFRYRYDAEIGNYFYQIFVQRFADVLTGALADVTITVENDGNCG